MSYLFCNTQTKTTISTHEKLMTSRWNHKTGKRYIGTLEHMYNDFDRSIHYIWKTNDKRWYKISKNNVLGEIMYTLNAI